MASPALMVDEEALLLKKYISIVEKYVALIEQQHTSTAPSSQKTTDEMPHYYESIIGVMPGNVYWLDKQGQALGCNQNVLDMLGLKSIEEYKGLNPEEIGQAGGWSNEAIQSFKHNILTVIKTGRAKLSIEEPPIPHSSGRMVYFLTNLVPLYDHTGEIIGVVGISVDISERRKMEQELRREKQRAESADRAKMEFIQNMQHDIRTPLNGIIGCSELIMRENISARAKEYTNHLIAASCQLLNELNEILEGIKDISGGNPILKKPFELKKQIENIHVLNTPQALTRNINFNLDYDDKIPQYLIGDPKRISRICLELVTNALKFTNKGSVDIIASLESLKDRRAIIKLIVADTGIGVSLYQQQEIFTRFKRLSPTHEGKYKGIGMGLAIVKQFIDDIEGELYVESALEKGTTFTCYIPVLLPLTSHPLNIDDTLYASAKAN